MLNSSVTQMYKELGECIELIIDHRGKTPKKLKSDWVDYGIPTISAKNISSGKLTATDSIRYVTHEVYKKWMKEDLSPGDCLLVSEGATLGEYLYWDNSYPVVLGQRLFGIRTNPEVLYPKYFYAYMTSNEFQREIISRSTGSSVSGLRQTEVRKLKVKILPMKLQIFIGDFIYNINKKIELNTKVNQTLEEIAQSIFKSWFVDFEPVKAKAHIKKLGGNSNQCEAAAQAVISGAVSVNTITQASDLSAIDKTITKSLEKKLTSQTEEQRKQLAETASFFPYSLVDSELGLIPEGWCLNKLGSYLEIKRGGSPRPIKEYIVPDGLPWLKIADATKEQSPFIFKTNEFIKKEGLKKTVLLKKGTLILTNSATPGLPKFLHIDACIHDGWLYFPTISKFTNEYLYFLFLKLKTELISQGNGSVFTNLKTDILRNQRISVPSNDIIQSFTTQTKSIFDIIINNCLQNQNLCHIRDSLLPKLLSGKLSSDKIQSKPPEAI